MCEDTVDQTLRISYRIQQKVVIVLLLVRVRSIRQEGQGLHCVRPGYPVGPEAKHKASRDDVVDTKEEGDLVSEGHKTGVVPAGLDLCCASRDAVAELVHLAFEGVRLQFTRLPLFRHGSKTWEIFERDATGDSLDGTVGGPRFAGTSGAGRRRCEIFSLVQKALGGHLSSNLDFFGLGLGIRDKVVELESAAPEVYVGFNDYSKVE